MLLLHCLHSVHGFERTVELVDEGAQETIVISLDIKGNTLSPNESFPVTTIDFTLRCTDRTTGECYNFYIVM